MVLVSITSKSFSYDVSAVTDEISRKILVYDNSESFRVEKSGKDIHIWLQGINGSYVARNEAFNFVEKGEIVLLIDDDVAITSYTSIDVKSGVLYVPRIEVMGRPKTMVELWYSKYAFDQEKFVLEERFAPTITWLFKYRGERFNSTLMSGGDIECSKKFESLEIIDGFTISTKLRSHDKILLKFQRQISGLAMRKSFYWMVLYTLKLFVLGTGGKVRSGEDLLLRLTAGYYKGFCVMNLLFRWKDRQAISINRNKIEVDA